MKSINQRTNKMKTLTKKQKLHNKLIELTEANCKGWILDAKYIQYSYNKMTIKTIIEAIKEEESYNK